MELEPFRDQELRQALRRLDAPLALKQRIMAARSGNHAHLRVERQTLWLRMAASVTIVAVLLGAGDSVYRHAEERRKGEEAKREVFMALRITGNALNHVQQKLAAHDRTGD